MQTLEDTTYVRLLHLDDSHDADRLELDVVKGGTRWCWLKPPVTVWNRRDLKEMLQLGLAKSKSHRLGRPLADEYQFDPTKRWPQGW